MASEEQAPYDGVVYTMVAHKLHKEGGNLGSLYTSVAESLLRRPHWQKGGSSKGRFHLLLGGACASGVPYKKLPLCESMFRIAPLVNFYRGFKALCRKAEFVHTFRQYTAALGVPFEDVAPDSFLFYPAKPERNETAQFLAAHAAVAAAEPGARNVWILKPSDGAKGNGIELMDDAAQIVAFLEGQEEGSIAWVVQRYIERPLLLPGRRKFDIRCWVLLTPGYGVRIYPQGVLRTTAAPYALDDLADRFAHLSNHCIAVQHPDYGKHGEATNEMWYHQFDGVLAAASGGRVSMARHILPQIHRICAHSFLAVRDSMEGTRGYHAFNLFGFDFMVDEDFRVSLIEINSSPAVAELLLPEFTEALVRTAIDPMFPPESAGADCGSAAAAAAAAAAVPTEVPMEVAAPPAAPAVAADVAGPHDFVELLPDGAVELPPALNAACEDAIASAKEVAEACKGEAAPAAFSFQGNLLRMQRAD